MPASYCGVPIQSGVIILEFIQVIVRHDTDRTTQVQPHRLQYLCLFTCPERPATTLAGNSLMILPQVVVHDELNYLTVFQVLIFGRQIFYIMFIVRQYGRMLKIVEIIEPNAAHNEDRC